jgi:hypothetical protein
MPNPALLRVALPAAAALAGWLGWKQRNHDEENRPKWRDDSLDDWRRERDEAREREREERDSESTSPTNDR